MCDSFDFQGKHYVLRQEMSQYKEAFTHCREALEETASIFAEPGYNVEMSGWKPDHSNETTKMYYNDRKNGRYFAGKTSVNLSAEKALDAIFLDVEGSVKWNDSYKFSKKHAQLSDECDIAHYGTNKKLIVDGREFIGARAVYRDPTGVILFSAKSTPLKEIKEGQHGIRAHLYISAGRLTPHPSDPSKSFYEYVICVDMKGMMFKSVLNPVLGRLLLEDVENVRKYCDKLSKQ